MSWLRDLLVALGLGLLAGGLCGTAWAKCASNFLSEDLVLERVSAPDVAGWPADGNLDATKGTTRDTVALWFQFGGYDDTASPIWGAGCVVEANP